MKKLAIIGASYLQNPLINKAKSMGIETHVFAWQVGDCGEKNADFFYPISIVDKNAILEQCTKIGIDGICSIATDLGSITVNYVADALGLVGNSLESAMISTNKHLMREAFKKNGDPSPRSYLVTKEQDLDGKKLSYPVIVKPTDRSGSRGITKVETQEQLNQAIEDALNESFEKKVLVEEFVEGQEFSVECISYKGKHHFLAMTKKYTSGSPFFVETGHLEPAAVPDEIVEKVKWIVFHALDTLKIQNGASHTELKIDNGKIMLIEIGGRMGGDCIGSDLVPLSTGVDYLRAVIDIALGHTPLLEAKNKKYVAAIRYIIAEEDEKALTRLRKEHPEYLVNVERLGGTREAVRDSSSRCGMFLMRSNKMSDLEQFLPE